MTREQMETYERQIEAAKIQIEEIKATHPSQDRILISIDLEEVESDLRGFRDGDQTDRELWIESRKDALRPSQDNAEVYILSLGGNVHDRFWLTNSIVAEVSVGRLDDLEYVPGFVAAFPDASSVEHIMAFDGFSSRVGGSRADEFVSQDYDGRRGGRWHGPDSPVRLGILEYASPLICNSYNWISQFGGTRLKHAGYCALNCSSRGELDSDVCRTSVRDDDANHAHGTLVTWIAAGSIEKEQHPDFQGPSNESLRVRHSGVAHETSIYYQAFVDGWFHSRMCAARRSFLELLEQGVDIVNMSFAAAPWRKDPWECVFDFNPCGFSRDIQAAYFGGVHTVAGSGNFRIDGPSRCNVSYPARLEVVTSVGALYGAGGGYRNSEIYERSSGGTARGTYRDSEDEAWLHLVDLLAPGDFAHWPDTSDTYTTRAHTATSFAAPHLSGILALQRNWLSEFGWNTNDVGRQLNRALLFGDGFTGGENVKYWVRGVHPYGGFGRVRAIWPSTYSLGPYFSWRNRRAIVGEGQILEWPLRAEDRMPISSEITGGKVVFSLLHGDPEVAVPDFSLRVIDRCPAEGGVKVIRPAARRDGNRKRIRLDVPEDQIHGRCLYAQVVGNSVRPGGIVVNVSSVLYSANSELF